MISSFLYFYPAKSSKILDISKVDFQDVKSALNNLTLKEVKENPKLIELIYKYKSQELSAAERGEEI